MAENPSFWSRASRKIECVDVGGMEAMEVDNGTKRNRIEPSRARHYEASLFVHR